MLSQNTGNVLKPSLFAFVPIGTIEAEGEDAIGSAAMPLDDQGAAHVRVTMVTDEAPRGPYPKGAYIEGWLDRARRGDRYAGFSFPLARAN